MILGGGSAILGGILIGGIVAGIGWFFWQTLKEGLSEKGMLIPSAFLCAYLGSALYGTYLFASNLDWMAWLGMALGVRYVFKAASSDS